MADSEVKEGVRAAETDVFVVHGRNQAARDALFVFLRAIGLRPIEWSHAVDMSGKSSPYIGEVLNAAFSNAQAVVVLLTGDDLARMDDTLAEPNDPTYEKELTPQARPNVLFEAGMAFGACADRTILVEVGQLRPFSDVAGRHAIRMSDSVGRRQQLAQRLMGAGCAVDISGSDWHTAGDFAAATAEDREDFKPVHGEAAEPVKETERIPEEEGREITCRDVSLPGLAEVVEFSGRITNPGESYSNFAWVLKLRLKGALPRRIYSQIQYLDGDGYPIQEHPFATPGPVQPGDVASFTGSRMIKNGVLEKTSEVTIHLNP